MPSPAAASTLSESRADIAVLTVIEPELDAARSALGLSERTKDAETGTIFWTGTVHSELTGYDYRVVLTCIGEAGNSNAAAAATEMQTKYKPRTVMLMGIAAGMRDKVKIGDAVWSDRVVAYESAALVKNRDEEARTEPRANADRVPHTILQDLVNYRPDEDRLQAIFLRMKGNIPAAPAGQEQLYSKHVTAKITFRRATIASGEKLLRDPDKIKALRREVHGKIEVGEMEAAGLVEAARLYNVPWLVVRGISDFGDDFKNDDFHVFASKAAAATLVDFIVHGLDIGPPSPPSGWVAAERASEQWHEETRDVIGSDVHVPRNDLQTRVVKSVHEAPVTVLLGDSGSGKSGLVKAIHRSGHFPTVTLCLHAQEAATLVHEHHFDASLKIWQKSGPCLLVLDGLDRVVGVEGLRLVARLMRALDLSSEAPKWKLLITCQATQWESVQQELISKGVQLSNAERIFVEHLENSEIDQVAACVNAIAPVLVRNDLRPVMGRPKVLDILARAAAAVGLPPDVAEWVGESSLIEWAWDKYIKGEGRSDEHSRLLQRIAARLADQRLFAIPIAELDGSETELLGSLSPLGVLVQRYDSVRFAHDLYADYARQRFLLSFFFSKRHSELTSRVGNPIWHGALRLVSLHMLEYRNSTHLPDIEGWRTLIRALDERKTTKAQQSAETSGGDAPRPGAGVDLALEAIGFAAQSRSMLDMIADDLVADCGVLLRSFLFRFNQSATVLVSLSGTGRVVRWPERMLWSPVIEWMVGHSQSVIAFASREFLDVATTWLDAISALVPANPFVSLCSRQLASMIFDMAERAVAAGDCYSDHSVESSKRVQLYQLMLLCGSLDADRVRTLARKLAGLEGAPEPRRPSVRRSIVPPEYGRSATKPAFWPNGPKNEPDRQFRLAALLSPGSERLVAVDPIFASEIFFALLIEIPETNRDGHPIFRYGFHFDAWRLVQNPFWDFAPAYRLLKKDPLVGVDFVVRVNDFATDRWAENWPDVPRDGALLIDAPLELPKIGLVVDGVEHEYIGDASVLEWHRGGGRGDNVSAATLMALEHWLYEEDEKRGVEPGILVGILKKSHSVAVVGVLLDLALKNPTHLIGALEPLVQCVEIYRWGRSRSSQFRMRSAMRLGSENGRVDPVYQWHNLKHRYCDFLRVVTYVFVAFQKFEWTGLMAARDSWSALAERASDEPLRAWIRDILLPHFDRRNWREVSEPDGSVAWEYAHPKEIEQRQSEARRPLEESSRRRLLPFRCRQIIDEQQEIDEQEFVNMLEAAAEPHENLTDIDAFMMGGAWTPRCGVAAVAVLRFPAWLAANAKWQMQCREWLIDACRSCPPTLRPDPSIGDISWDSFCSDALPVLWALEPGDQDVRQCIAFLVASSREDARTRLFNALTRNGGELGEDFLRLLHLAVWVSRMIFICPPPSYERPYADVLETLGRFTEDFVGGKFEPIPEKWAEISQAWPNGLPNASVFAVRGEYDGFHEACIISAFSWLTRADLGSRDVTSLELLRRLREEFARVIPLRLSMSISDEEERSYRQLPSPEALLRRVNLESLSPAGFQQRPGPMATVVPKLKRIAFDSWARVRARAERVLRPGSRVARSAPPRRRRPIETPYETDHRFAAMVALFVVQERDPTRRRALWEPWFRLEDSCCHWVEMLVDEIYAAGANVKDVSVFSDLMQELFEAALAVGGWLDGQARHVRRMSDVGSSFIGFGKWASRQFWSSGEHASVAVALREYWPRWADAAIDSYGCAANFLQLLRQPSMKPLRPASLEWLVRSSPDAWLSDTDAQAALLWLLLAVWQERDEAGHELDGAAWGIFMRLLQELNARHFADAFRLSELVAHER